MEKTMIRDPEAIDIQVIIKKVWDNRKLFRMILPIVFVLSCIYIFSIPRYSLNPQPKNWEASLFADHD